MTITVNFNSRPVLDASVQSVLEQETAGEHHVVLWENGDDKDVFGVAVGESSEVNGKQLHHVGLNKNLGYAPAVQRSWQWVRRQSWAANISHVHLATPDTYATSTDVLGVLCARATSCGAIVGPVMRDGNGGLRPSAYPLMRPYNLPLMYLSTGWMTRFSKVSWWRPRSGHVGTLDGAYLVFPRAVWDGLGGLDQNYYLYTDDHDVCRRAHKLGVGRWRESSVEVTHEGGLSRVSRRVLCELDEVRCVLRYVEVHFGRVRAAALRRLLAVELSSRWGRLRGLSWWARHCPVSFPTSEMDLSIEDRYLDWLVRHDDTDSRNLYSALRQEVGS